MTTIPNIKILDDKKHIFCLIRRKWLILTPEEKVRQFILHQFIEIHNYPQKYISVEKTISVNELRKRYDIVVYNTALQPKILVECKSEDIPISEKTAQQIATYNLTLNVPFLMVTNGQNSYFFEIKNGISFQINTFPNFNLL